MNEPAIAKNKIVMPTTGILSLSFIFSVVVVSLRLLLSAMPEA